MGPCTEAVARISRFKLARRVAALGAARLQDGHAYARWPCTCGLLCLFGGGGMLLGGAGHIYLVGAGGNHDVESRGGYYLSNVYGLTKASPLMPVRGTVYMMLKV